jgi:ketosteroid isomerase-like protein
MIEIVTVRDGKITELVPYYWDTARLVKACGGVVTPA